MAWLRANWKHFQRSGSEVQCRVEQENRCEELQTGPLPPVLNNAQFIAFMGGADTAAIEALDDELGKISHIREWMEFHYPQEDGSGPRVPPHQVLHYSKFPNGSPLQIQYAMWREEFGLTNFEEKFENKIRGHVFVMIAGTGDGSYYPLERAPPTRLPNFCQPGQAHGRNAGQAQGSRPDQPPRAPQPPPPAPRAAELKPAPIGSRELNPQDKFTPCDSFECGTLFGSHYTDGALTQDVINNRNKSWASFDPPPAKACEDYWGVMVDHMNDALGGVEVPLTLDKHWDRHKGACPYTWRDVAWLYDEFDENFCKGVCNARGENGTTVLHSACKVMQIERVNKILAWESKLAKAISNEQPTEKENKNGCGRRPTALIKLPLRPHGASCVVRRGVPVRLGSL